MVSWKTRKLDVVALSTTEVEYKALLDTVKEVIWLLCSLRELDYCKVWKPLLDICMHHETETLKQWKPLLDTHGSKASTSVETAWGKPQ